MTNFPRPTPITLIAWIWIITGGLMVFGAIMASLIAPSLSPLVSSGGVNPQIQRGLAVTKGTLPYFVLLAIAQLALGAVAVIAGIGFLKLRCWARTFLEIISWISLVYVISSGIIWLFTWWTTHANVARQIGPDTQRFEMVGLVMGAVSILAFAIPLAIIIYCLRGHVVRRAVQCPN